MQKKKFTSWGVSFASLALVAGMMSYMGITNKDTTSTVATTHNSTQVYQSESNQDSSITYEVPSQSTDTSESTDTFGTGQSDEQSVSQDHSFSSQHGGFDTTTGGT